MVPVDSRLFRFSQLAEISLGPRPFDGKVKGRFTSVTVSISAELSTASFRNDLRGVAGSKTASSPLQ